MSNRHSGIRIYSDKDNYKNVVLFAKNKSTARLLSMYHGVMNDVIIQEPKIKQELYSKVKGFEYSLN